MGNDGCVDEELTTLFNPKDEISVETVETMLLPNEPALKGLIDEYHKRVANGENMAIYLMGSSLMMGPRGY